MEFNKRKRKLIYLILLGVLILPFVLRSLNQNLEPYPAILFPSGATKVNLQDSFVTFKRTEIIALNHQGLEITLAPGDVFSDIPPYIFNEVTKNRFGMNDTDDMINLDEAQDFNIIKSSKSSEEDIMAAAQFFRNVLGEYGMKDSILIIRDLDVEFDVISRKEKSRKIRDEEILILD